MAFILIAYITCALRHPHQGNNATKLHPEDGQLAQEPNQINLSRNCIVGPNGEAVPPSARIPSAIEEVPLVAQSDAPRYRGVDWDQHPYGVADAPYPVQGGISGE